MCVPVAAVLPAYRLEPPQSVNEQTMKVSKQQQQRHDNNQHTHTHVMKREKVFVCVCFQPFL